MSPTAIRPNRVSGFMLDDPSVGGAPANGSDDTTTITNVFAACMAAGGVPMVVPANKTYRYAGTGLDNGAVRGGGVVGADRNTSVISLTTGTTLFKLSGRIDRWLMRDLTVTGGVGAFHNTWTGASVGKRYVFDNVEFTAYTGCAIANEAFDSPYLTVTRCFFQATDFLASIGVAWSGNGDNMYIAGNTFAKNRVNLKLLSVLDSGSLKGPHNSMIAGNDFIHLARGGSDPAAIHVWIVPGTANTVNTGFVYLDGNKFGSENLQAGDHHLLFADEDASSGIDNSTRMPDLTNSSLGCVSNVVLLPSNTLANSGTSSAPTVSSFCYSTTVDVRDCVFAGQIRGNAPLYILELKDDPKLSASATAKAAQRYNQGNIIGPVQGTIAGLDSSGLRGSNYHGMGYMNDPTHRWAGRNSAMMGLPGGQSLAGYVDLLSPRVSTYTLVSATLSAVTDSQGGADATEITFSAAGRISHTLGTFTPGQPLWIDFDIGAPATGTPLTTVELNVFDSTGAAIIYRRASCDVPSAGWESRRFWFNPRETTSAELRIASAGAGTVRIGRVQAYHAREPVSHGPILLRQPNGTLRRLSVDNTGTLVVT